MRGRKRSRRRGVAVWAAFLAAVLSVAMLPVNAHAATLDRTGFASVPADTVQIDYPLGFDDVQIDFGNTGCTIAPNTSITTSETPCDAIYYPGSVAAGTTLNGSITLRWDNCGRDADGSAIDVIITLSNIHFRDSGVNPAFFGWLQSRTMWFQSTSVFGGNTSDVQIDATIRVYKHGTSTPASGTMLCAFKDIDVPHEGERYSESVKLVSGFGGTVWLQQDSMVAVSEDNTRFTGTQSYDGSDYRAGLVTTASTSGHTIRWWGSVCGTSLLTPFKVNEQRITASAGSGGSISSPGVTSLRWKNDKSYTITPNPGYHISNVTVDGKSVGTPSTYTFREVTSDHTIRAEFAPNSYTVKFDGNGSGVTGTTASMSMTYDQTRNLTQNGFSRPGYTFQGWNTGPNGNGVGYADGQSVRNLTTVDDGTVTLYAQWKENPPVTITYKVSDAEHGTLSSGSESVAPATGEAAGSSVTVSEGYRLVSWTDADGNVVGSGTSFMPSRGADGLWYAGTYTANIEPNRYLITFDANGGTGTMVGQPMTYDVAADLNENVFIRMGYTFQGWSTTRDGGVEFSDQQEVINLTAEHGGGVTLYAVWEPITYTVVFEKGADGATGSTESMTMTYDEWKNLSENGFSYEGHTFTAWVMEEDDSGDSRAFSDGQAVRNLSSIDGDVVTLIAQWTIISNRVTFVDHDGSVLGTELVEWDEDATSPEEPTRKGHTFTGWDKDYTHVKEPVTVTAQYRPNAYEVAFDSNGGEGEMDNQPMTYDVAEELTANAFARSGYTFRGWATEPDGAIAYADRDTVVNLTAEDGGLVTLYAIWDENAPVQVTYKVSDPEHGTLTSEGETLAPATGEAAGSTVTVSTGYRFTGWTDSEGNKVGTETTYLPSRGADGLWEPETYTANIEPIDYEVAFDANGGEGKMDNQPMTYDVAALLEKNSFSRDGYAFTGWATEPEGEVSYRNMQEVTNLTAEDGGTVTLYAVWKENAPATITYRVSDPEHATLSTKSESLAPATGEAAGSTVTISEGYRVVAWLDEDGNEVGTDAAFVPSRGESGLWEDATYTAQVSPIRYEVAFDSNGGEGEMANQPMSYDVAEELSANAFARKGFAFLGWATEPEGEAAYEDKQEVINLTAESGGTVTLYAVWSEIGTVDVTYVVSDPEHGTLTSEGETLAPLTGEAEGSTVTLSEGYRFVGWTDEDGNGVGADEAFVPSRGADGLWHAGTYTANIEPISYVILFDANGGEGEMDPMRMTYDVAAALTENGYSYEGHTFMGWATEPDGDVRYKDMQEVTNLSAEEGGTVTLYAVWEPDTFTVRFVLPDGTLIDQQEVAYGEDATAPKDPELRNRTFLRWDKDFTDVTGDLTVTAVFEGDVSERTTHADSGSSSSGGYFGKTGGSDAAIATGAAFLAAAAVGAAAYGLRQRRRAGTDDAE